MIQYTYIVIIRMTFYKFPVKKCKGWPIYLDPLTTCMYNRDVMPWGKLRNGYSITYLITATCLPRTVNGCSTYT